MNPYAAYSMPMPAYPVDGFYTHYNTMHPPPNCSPHHAPYGYYNPGHVRPGTAQPTTRTHTRHKSSGDGWKNSYKGKFSPRYHSSGYYATAAPNVSRKCFWSAPCRMRSHSASQPVPGVDSEDEVYNFVDNENEDEEIYRYERHRPKKYGYNFRGHSTDHRHYSQAPYYAYEEEIVVPDEVVPDPFVREKPRKKYHEALDDEDEDADEEDVLDQEEAHARRHERSSRRTPKKSHTLPKRAQTARPSAAPKKPHQPVVATESDAMKHHIPPGFSLKNWDPTEQPILLLGSVFDANSLGKWIYDWTAYHHGAGTPIADMAGELWILLIQLTGKLKRAEECMPLIRSKENYEMIDDFVASGDRLTEKLKKLLKACETPMLKASKSSRNPAQLGKRAGIEFVDSIFGRDRQLSATERFMSSIRLWNHRFDANCDEILSRPTE